MLRNSIIAVLALVAVLAGPPVLAADVEGCGDHPAVSRYPGTDLLWCVVENYMEYKVPLGPVAGYRAIGEWEETEGRVTRNFYLYSGTDRTHGEIYKNYLDAFEAGGFTILASGVFTGRNVKGDVGGGSWQDVVYRTNAWSKGGPANRLVSGTSSSGGTGAVVAKKERAEDTIYVVFTIEQHSSNEVAMLVDIVETQAAEIGLVTANAEAMGKDIEELGRTVLDGLFFDHDKATLTSESTPALLEIAKFLQSAGDRKFYVVGHTDATGAFAYNMKLSADRAEAVRQALVTDHGIPSGGLQAAGVGPLCPVFTNGADSGREKNRRVELVEQ